MEIKQEDLVSDLEKRQIEFENRVKEKHGDLYSIDRTEYTNARAKINVHCNKHNSDMIVAARSLLNNETSCKTCYSEKFSNSQDNFVKEAKAIFKKADEVTDIGTTDLLSRYILEAEKNIWMLKASLK